MSVALVTTDTQNQLLETVSLDSEAPHQEAIRRLKKAGEILQRSPLRAFSDAGFILEELGRQLEGCGALSSDSWGKLVLQRDGDFCLPGDTLPLIAVHNSLGQLMHFYASVATTHVLHHPDDIEMANKRDAVHIAYERLQSIESAAYTAGYVLPNVNFGYAVNAALEGSFLNF